MKVNVIISKCIFLYSNLYSSTNELNTPVSGSEFIIHTFELKPYDFGPGNTGENISWIMTDTVIIEVISINVFSHSITSYEWWSTVIPFPFINMEMRSASNAPDKFYMYYLVKSHYIDVGQLESENSEMGL